MIETMLKIENIQILESVSDWKEAVHVSVLPSTLVKNKKKKTKNLLTKKKLIVQKVKSS